jgi:GGDEF domain-containing protein
MQNTDAAIAADLPNGDTYTTESGELLFSLQALLIREAEGEGEAVSFVPTRDPVEQPRWALDEAPASSPVVETIPAVAPTVVVQVPPVIPESEIVAEPEIALESEIVAGAAVLPEPEIALDPELPQVAVPDVVPAAAAEPEPLQIAEPARPADTSSPSPSWIVEPEPQQVLFDPTTGAPTTAALRQEIERHGSRVSSSLVALDVTPIGDIRVQYGDAAADAVLRAIVEAVPFALRAEDQVFRTGIDDLTLCVPGADLSDAAVMGLRLQMAVKDVLVRRELPAVILSIRPYQQVAA